MARYPDEYMGAAKRVIHRLYARWSVFGVQRAMGWIGIPQMNKASIRAHATTMRITVNPDVAKRNRKRQLDDARTSRYKKKAEIERVHEAIRKPSSLREKFIHDRRPGTGHGHYYEGY